MRWFIALFALLIFSNVLLQAQGVAPTVADPTMPQLFKPNTTPPMRTGFQTGDQNNGAPDERASLAMTSSDYSVTPGDVYNLSYISANGMVNLPLIADADSVINIPNIGTVDAHEMRFYELRKTVEKKILDSYAFSAPRLIMQSCGIFPVYIQGEVIKSETLYVWGLSRLSELWDGVTPYASNRIIQVYSKNGQKRSCDLYNYWRSGDLAQNPYLKPFDRVVFSKYALSITLSGEVRRAGIYQLLRGEGIIELITKYGDGYTINADPARIRIDRHDTGTELANEVIFFDASVANSMFELRDQDTVTVQPRLQTDHSIRTIILVGEVRRPGTYTIRPRESIEDLLQKYGDGYTVNADATRIRIDRRDTGTQLANAVIFFDASSVDSQFDLRDQDTVTVQPRLQTDHSVRTIVLAGEIRKPGTYAIRPSEDLNDLLVKYGDGLTVNADPSRIRIDRHDTGTELANAVIFFDTIAKGSHFELRDQDTITVQPRLQTDHSIRTIMLGGEVRRPGTYTIRPGEGLSDLLEKYGDGYTVNADSSRIRIDRHDTGTELANNVVFFDASVTSVALDLKDQDTVTVQPRLQTDHSVRSVTISGEVRRPGSYTLRPGEGMAVLIRDYADGITDKGDPQKITIARLKSANYAQGELLHIDLTATSDVALENLDTVIVGSKLDWLPSVYFEGAIGNTLSASIGDVAGVAGANRVNYPFFYGEMLSNAVFAVKKSFTAVSDLKKAYIIRGKSGTRIPIDLSKFITEHDLSSDLALENNDYIIIPFRQYFITVAGAVRIPGRYPYVPDRTWKYYTNLAGGIDTERNAWNTLTISDIDDKVKAKNSILQPEDKILVASNSFLYFFTQISGVTSVLVSTVTLFFSLKSLLKF
jgi:protein involved in polysaccharide export with SLBB domain